jgi:vacuolar-type H+-ATPase subunit H
MLIRAKDQAEKLLDESQIKRSAEHEAKSLFNECSEHAKRLTKDAESDAETIRMQAIEKAQRFEEQALLKARRIKEDADNYAQQILSYIENDVVRKIDELNVKGKSFFSELKEKDLHLS